MGNALHSAVDIRDRPVAKCNPLLSRVIKHDPRSRPMGDLALDKWEHDGTENMQILCWKPKIKFLLKIPYVKIIWATKNWFGQPSFPSWVVRWASHEFGLIHSTALQQPHVSMPCHYGGELFFDPSLWQWCMHKMLYLTYDFPFENKEIYSEFKLFTSVWVPNTHKSWSLWIPEHWKWPLPWLMEKQLLESQEDLSFSKLAVIWLNFMKEFRSSLAKSPLKYNGGFATPEFTSLKAKHGTRGYLNIILNVPFTSSRNPRQCQGPS